MITDVSRLRLHRCTIITSIASDTDCGGRIPSCASALDKGHQSNKTLVAIDFAEIRHHPTPRRQPPDNQADIATLKERITALQAELCAEQQRSGDCRTDFERERNRADDERERADHLMEQRDQLVVELEALRTLLEEASGPVAERPWRWWPRRAG